MNWKEINKKYPKSFNLFFKWFKGDPKATMTKKEFLEMDDIIMYGGDIRDLYDFFDEQEIYIFPLKGEYHTKVLGFGYEIQHKTRDRQHGYKSRKKAEEAAFLKAFEILEEYLGDSQVS